MKKIPFYKSKRFLTSLFGIFIISIMLLSVLNVYETKDESNNIEYNGELFTNNGNYWILNLNGNNLYFLYNPLELKGIDLFDYNLNNKIYLAYDPVDLNNELFVIRESTNLLNYMNVKPVISCYEEKDCPDIPLVNCNDYDSIILKYNENKTNIYKEGRCLVLEGNPEYQLKYINKMVYNGLGI